MDNETKDFIRRVLKKNGGKITPSYMVHLLKRHTNNRAVETDEIAKIMSEVKPPVPVPDLRPIVAPRKGKDVRGIAIDVINEIKAKLQDTGPYEAKAERVKNGVTPLLFLSDLHFGEIVEVNGEVVFDLEIADRNLAQIVDEFIESKELAGYEVDEIVVLLGGDIIDGELIFNAQAFSTENHALAQIKSAIDSIYWNLTRLREEFQVPIRVFCCPGNHGRASKLHHPMSNWDNVLYFALQLVASIEANMIEVHTPNQSWIDFKVREWNVHMRHIGVTQTVTAGPAKKTLVWMDGHQADLMFFGHFHCPEMFSLGHRRIFKNGSLPPLNDFAENLGFLDGMGQWMIGITDTDSVAFAKILQPSPIG